MLFFGFECKRLFWCLQYDPNSLCAFKEQSFGLLKRYNFSLVHSWHVFETGLKDLPLSMIFHFIMYLIPPSLSFQMYLLSSVSVLYDLRLKDFVWLLNLCLKGGAVRPMYVSVCCVFVSITVAW